MAISFDGLETPQVFWEWLEALWKAIALPDSPAALGLRGNLHVKTKQTAMVWQHFFFVFWVCLQLRALALQPHWLWIGLLWCDPSRTTSQASGIRNMSVWYVWIFWNTLDVVLRQLLVDSWTYCIIMLWNNEVYVYVYKEIYTDFWKKFS